MNDLNFIFKFKFYLSYAVIHEKEKSILCTILYESYLRDADFRCFWVTLSCLATSVFVENLKT